MRMLEMHKKNILIIGVIIILIILALISFYLFKSKGKERTTEEIMRDLTSNSTTGADVSPEVIENLSAPEEKEASSTPDDIINSLTAPELK